mgnify:FL=1
MSSSPLGKNRKAMWQSLVMSLVHRLHQDDARPHVLRGTMEKIALEADFMIEELEKRFPHSEVTSNPAGGYKPAPQRPTLPTRK